MAQLFDRLRTFLASELADGDDSVWADSIIDSHDEELRAAIDALGASPVVEAARVLRVSPSATILEVRAAWRQRMFEVHPDRIAAADEATQRMAAQRVHTIQAAYETFRRHLEAQ